MLPSEGLDSPATSELTRLRTRRRELVNRLASLKAFGYDAITREDEDLVKVLDRQILELRAKADC